MNGIIFVPEEDRTLVIVEEERTIEIPAEVRVIEVTKMPLVASNMHTAGDTKRWIVKYEKWLANTATIEQFTLASSLPDWTVGNIQILGTDVIFFLSGGAANETTTLSMVMTDSLGNIKNDTARFTGVAA